MPFLLSCSISSSVLGVAKRGMVELVEAEVRMEVGLIIGIEVWRVAIAFVAWLLDFEFA